MGRHRFASEEQVVLLLLVSSAELKKARRRLFRSIYDRVNMQRGIYGSIV